MLDPHPALLTQFGPELAEHLGGRTHAPAPDQLVEPVRGRRDAEPEEQQRADFAVQLARLREFGLQAVDFGRNAGFVRQNVGHGRDFGDIQKII
jgi:hypothetical protein